MVGKISLEECEDRVLYRIHSRNLSYGVFNQETRGFIGIREKLGDEYLSTEYHRDIGSPHGTVSPQEKLKLLPLTISTQETLCIVSEKSRRPVEQNTNARGWRFKDTGEVCEEYVEYVDNQDLFRWLKEIEG